MEVDDGDDVMEIDPSWEKAQSQPECIDMTSDDDTPLVINIQEKDTATDLLKNILLSSQNASSELTTVQRSISKLNEISLTSVSSNDRHRSSNGNGKANISINQKASKETDCIEIDDDISICDLPPSSSSDPSEISFNSVSSTSRTNRRSSCNQKALDLLIAEVIPDEDSYQNNFTQEQPKQSKNSHSDDCEILILTDDEEKDECASSPNISEALSHNDRSVKSNEQIINVSKSKNYNPEMKSNKNHLSEKSSIDTNDQVLSKSDDKDCEMVILTDDDSFTEEKDENKTVFNSSEGAAVSGKAENTLAANKSGGKLDEVSTADENKSTSKSTDESKNGVDYSSDKDCEMVILTDDESVSDEKDKKETVSDVQPVSTKSVVSDDEKIYEDSDVSTANGNEQTKKSADCEVKTSVDDLSGKDCEMVVLTDDESVSDEKDKKETVSDVQPVSRKSVVSDDEKINQDSDVSTANGNKQTKKSADCEVKTSVDHLSGEDCEMVVLTDDESVSDEKDKKKIASNISEVPVVSAKSVMSDAKVENTDKMIKTTAKSAEVTGDKNPSSSKPADSEVKTIVDDSSDQDCEMVILTDDESVPEEKDDKISSGASVASGKTDMSDKVNDSVIKPKANDEVIASSDKNSLEKHSSDKESGKTEKNYETVVITDDENMPEEKGEKKNSLRSAEGTIVGKSINPNAKDDDAAKFKAPKPPGDVEVIDVDAVREKRPGSYECVNPNCKFGLGLQEAEEFVIAYYNVKSKAGLKMCAECYNTAMNYADKLLINLEQHKSIFDVPYNRDSLVVSLDLDSDDESEKKNVSVAKKRKRLTKASEKYLDETIQEILDKYDFKFQMEEGSKKVTSEIDRIKAEFDSMKLEIDEHQKTLVGMFETIHGPYRPQYTQMQELQIIDCQIKPHGFRIPLKTPRSRPLAFRPGIAGSLTSVAQSRQSRVPPSPPRLSVATKKVTPYNKSGNTFENFNPSANPSSSDIFVQYAPSKIIPPANLPGHGALVRPPIKPNQVIYFMKSTLYGVWIPGKVVKVAAAEKKHLPFKFVYKIRPEPLKKYQDAYRSVLGKFMAYHYPANVRLPFGTRVIAIFKEENARSKNDKFYAGVIAELPRSINKFRYLVFFDDGYAQYIHHQDIRVVCESSPNVWDDVLPEFKDFIRRYVIDYPEIPMVKLQKKQMVKTEWNGKWWIARVMDIDSSLVKMLFDADRRVEWIYRGSTRLGPLFAAHKRQESGEKGVRGLNSSLRNRNMPYVEYTCQESEGKDRKGGTVSVNDELGEKMVEKRAVARKSGTGKPVLTRPADKEKKENQRITNRYPTVRVPSKMDLIDTSKAVRPRRFTPHQCGPRCVSWVGYNPDKGCGYGPCAVPLLFGFERVLNRVKNKGVIFYVGPCGRRLRNISEIHRYLRITKSEMTVDQFSFEEWVNCLSEFKITRWFNFIKDLSYGKEKQPISCVNYLDNLMPNYVEYITEREPREGVHMNLDPDFLVCCDCTDDCQDKEKCACWKLTMDNQKIIRGIEDSELSQGYIYRRLPERIVTGIYECNSRCHCSKTSCLNRVVQHPLTQKLQLFKTDKKGWGIRCLNDIPIGSFICIYAGLLLTESSANKEGKERGDEYLAELDYIEVIERIKEDYEEDVPSELMSDAEKSEETSSSEEDSETVRKNSRPTSPGFRAMSAEFELKCAGDQQSEFKMMLRKKPDKPKKKSKDGKSSSDQEKNSDKEEEEGDSDSDDRRQERAPMSFDPSIEEDPGDERSQEKSLRNLFGEDECVYVMDANCNGNIGRYLNHSCEPNVFVQNVFVDTHDLRFPWVAFFALNYIPAGSELTWDYNYDVNSVPGKVLYCYCNSSECRGRLL